MPHPNDPSLRSFIPVDANSDFPIQNLPYGVFSTATLPTPRVGVAIGEFVLDLRELEQDNRLDVGPLGVFSSPSLNPFMSLGPKVWERTRDRISELLREDHPELRDNDELRKLALVPMKARKASSADHRFRLYGFLRFERARQQCRNHISRQGQCLATELAAHADWLQRPGFNDRRFGHQGAPPARSVETA